MQHTDRQLSLWVSSQNNLALVFLKSRCHCRILNQTCRAVTDEKLRQQSNLAFLPFCFIRQSPWCVCYLSIAVMKTGSASTTSSPFSFPVCTGGKGAVKQLEIHLILRISIHSSQNRLQTWNIVSIYASYQITWFFSRQVFSWLTSWGKAMVQGQFHSHV